MQFIYKRDRQDKFRFLSLQSTQAQQILKNHHYSETALKSFVLISGGKLYTKSTAALKVAEGLGFPYSLALVFFIVPAPVRNLVYDFVARNRYKWFGKEKEICEFNSDFQEKMTWNK